MKRASLKVDFVSSVLKKMKNKTFEQNGDSFTIDISTENGTAEGYTVKSHAVQLRNWLENFHIHDEELISQIRSKYDNIGFLNNINVDQGCQGQGIGTELLTEFEQEARIKMADAILLVADIHETQEQGFDLVRWYKSHKYEILIETSSGPLMIKNI